MLEYSYSSEALEQNDEVDTDSRGQTIVPQSVASANIDKAADNQRYQTLDIDRIQLYENAPRLVRNIKWHGIKDSIRASGGLTNTLAVTRRPDEAHYVCHQGGNTRLLALKELFAETNDPSFAQVQAEIVPYGGEFEIAFLHDRENTCRGDLSYIELAWSKYRLYELFTASTDGKKTARAFVAEMRTKHGADFTVEEFSRIKYVIEVLYQYIPTCLVQGGMSLRAVRRLISVRNGLRKMWIAREVGSAAHFDETFYGLLARQDEELTLQRESTAEDDRPDYRLALDWDRFLSDFQYEVSTYAEISYQKAVGWVVAAMRHLTLADDAASTSPPSPNKPVSCEQAMPVESMSTLRLAAFGHARQLAASAGIEDLIEPSTGSFGYKLAGELPSFSKGEAKACWWALAMATEPSAKIKQLVEMLPEAPSFAELSSESLTLLSKLLAAHALITKKGTL